MEAYLQMLRIHRFEEDEETRLRCLELVEKAVLPAAIGNRRGVKEAEKVRASRRTVIRTDAGLPAFCGCRKA